MIKDQSVFSANRNAWFDNAKAFLILTVFIGHICEVLINTNPFEGGRPLWLDVLMKSIYVFHMPVFMIISGRFSKSRVDRNDWVSTINKLIIPYIVVHTVMTLFYSTVGFVKVTDISYFRPAHGLWYLITLASYQLITPHLLKIFRRKWLLFFLSLIMAFALTFQENVFFGGFQRFFSFFPFFIFGYLTATCELKFCKKVIFRIFSIAAFIGLVFLIIQYNDIVKIAMLSGKRVYSQYQSLMGLSQVELLVQLLFRYAMGFIFFFFIMGISPIKKNLFTRIGAQSTYIYILHLFVIVALTAYGKEYGILNFCSNEIYAILLCIAAIPISFLFASPLIEKYTKWLVSPDFDLRRLIQTLLKEEK